MDAYASVADKLLEHGAGRVDLDHVDKKGRTPLELALEAGSELIKGLLLAAEARLSAGSTKETNHDRELLLPGTDSTDIPPTRKITIAAATPFSTVQYVQGGTSCWASS